MNEPSALLILLAIVGAALLVRHLVGRALHGEPSGSETITVSPNGEVLIRSCKGATFAFHRNELRCVRERDLVNGISEVVIDLFERRIVVAVSSKAVQQAMVWRLAR